MLEEEKENEIDALNNSDDGNVDKEFLFQSS